MLPSHAQVMLCMRRPGARTEPLCPGHAPPAGLPACTRNGLAHAARARPVPRSAGALSASLNLYRANVRAESFGATRFARFSRLEPHIRVLGVWSSGDPALTEAQMRESARYVAPGGLGCPGWEEAKGRGALEGGRRHASKLTLVRCWSGALLQAAGAMSGWSAAGTGSQGRRLGS